MRESRLVQQIERKLREQYPSCFYAKLSDKFTRGLPDLILVYRQITVWIETKVRANDLSEIQKAVHRKIRGAGGTLLVARSWDEVKATIEQIDRICDDENINNHP